VPDRSCANYPPRDDWRNEKLATAPVAAYTVLMTDDTAARLAKMEAHIAHLERLCDQLNQVITEQSRDLTRLKAQQARIAETVENAELERIRATNPKPPHYQ
jgi:uncharacterized coiled-coil protein SlyX